MSIYITNDLSTYANSQMVYTGSAWVSMSKGLNHQDLSGAGTLTHANIDSYLNQSVKTTARPTFFTGTRLLTNIAAGTQSSCSFFVGRTATPGNCAYINHFDNTVDLNYLTMSIYGFSGLRIHYDSHLEIPSTNASTTTQTGALVVAGGVGIGGKIYTGNDINCATTITGNNFICATAPASGNYLCNKTYVDGAVSGLVTVVDQDKIFYVSDSGSDTINNGKNINKPFKTNGKAITMAITGSEYSHTTIICLEGLDSSKQGTYTLKDFTHLYNYGLMRYTKLTLNRGCSINGDYWFVMVAADDNIFISDTTLLSPVTVNLKTFKEGGITIAANMGLNFFNIDNIVRTNTTDNCLIVNTNSSARLNCKKIRGKITATGSNAAVYINGACDLSEATIVESAGGRVYYKEILIDTTTTVSGNFTEFDSIIPIDITLRRIDNRGILICPAFSYEILIPGTNLQYVPLFNTNYAPIYTTEKLIYITRDGVKEICTLKIYPSGGIEIMPNSNFLSGEVIASDSFNIDYLCNKWVY